MKLSTYAKQLGISYQTAWRLFKDGKLNAYKLPTGTVIVREEGERSKRSLFTVVSVLRKTRGTRSGGSWIIVLRRATIVNRVVTEVGSTTPVTANNTN
jgi:predicted site-specific integrase-resolvase